MKKSKVAAEPAVTPDTNAKFIELDAGANKVLVGSVAVKSIAYRRENYRKQSELQQKTMDSSIERHGFQSLIVVVEESPGVYGIVDGHHRYEQLLKRGAEKIPVIKLPSGTSKKDADLGMLTFNVSAEIKDKEFADLITELMKEGATNEEVMSAANISENFLKSIQSALQDIEIPEPTPGEEELPQEIKETSKKAKKVPQLKNLVLLVRDEESGAEDIVQIVQCPRDLIVPEEVRSAFENEGLYIQETEAIVLADEDAVTQFAVDFIDEMHKSAQEPEETEEPAE